MLSLPSGRVVDLSSDRAKYHALRHEPGFAPGTLAEHKQLHALVDVIYRKVDAHGMPRRGWTEYDYHFSGYTIADIRHAPDWPEADKVVFSHWIRQADQRRVIETARRRLLDFQHTLSVKQNSAPQHLYSLLQRRIAALPLQQGSAGQWQATIRNMRKNGVRGEEIQWSGLESFLSGQQAETILSKGQLLESMDFSSLRIELSLERQWGAHGGLSFREVAQRMPHQAVYRAALKLDDSCHCVLRYVDSRYNYRVGVVKTLAYGHAMGLNKFWFVLDPYGRAIPPRAADSLFFPSSEAAMAAAHECARESLGVRSGARFHTRFDHLTLYGGSDYREWIVSLPEHQRIFFGAHHFDHNVLAHVRTTSRTDEEGRRLLFIEEVQSDWHQSGQRYGYDTTIWGRVANAPFKKEWAALVAKLMLIRASQNGFDGIAWAPGAIQESRYVKPLQAIKRHYDQEIPQALDRLGRPFACRVASTRIETRDPWLNLERSRDKWRVADGAGKFQTRAKYQSREEAMAVLARHCRTIHLTVPVFFISNQLRWQIAEDGLPLFGETFK